MQREEVHPQSLLKFHVSSRPSSYAIGFAKYYMLYGLKVLWIGGIDNENHKEDVLCAINVQLTTEI